MSLLKKYVFDPIHMLPKLPHATHEGKLLTEQERMLKVDMQCLWNTSFQRLFLSQRIILKMKLLGKKRLIFERITLALLLGTMIDFKGEIVS